MSLVPINRCHSNLLDHLCYYPPYSHNFYSRPHYWDDSLLWRYPSSLLRPMDELVVRRIRNQLIRSSLDKWAHPTHWNNHYAGEHVQVDERGFRVDIDVSAYKPHEVKVTTNDDYVCVEGKHSELTSGGHHMIERNFTRKYRLPSGLNPNDIISDLSSDGVLTIKALPPISSKHLDHYTPRSISILDTGRPALSWK